MATIAAAVMERLRRRGLVSAVAGEAGDVAGDVERLISDTAEEVSRADIHPPAGVCTGDYSKFTELHGRLPAASPGRTPSDSPAPGPVALTGIVTAERLRAAMQASPNGEAVLAADARLTPLANDLARELPRRIRRVTDSVDGSVSRGTAVGLPWLSWCDGRCPAVEAIERRHRARLRPTGAPRDPAAVAQVVCDLVSAVRGGRVAGGLLFVATAARAMCFTNRCASLRAVLGTCDQAVQQGMDELGANVLVVEYPHIGRRAMIDMVDRILASATDAPPAVQRTLAQLHRCGG